MQHHAHGFGSPGRTVRNAQFITKGQRGDQHAVGQNLRTQGSSSATRDSCRRVVEIVDDGLSAISSNARRLASHRLVWAALPPIRRPDHGRRGECICDCAGSQGSSRESREVVASGLGLPKCGVVAAMGSGGRRSPRRLGVPPIPRRGHQPKSLRRPVGKSDRLGGSQTNSRAT